MRAIENIESWVGRHVGPYEIVAILGTRASEVIFQGKHEKLDSYVTLTSLPDQSRSSTAEDERLAEYKQNLSALNHPCVSRFVAVVEAHGRTFVVHEQPEGQTLAEFISENSAKMEEPLIVILLKIAQTLADVQSSGLSIPSLNLQDIRVDPRGRITLPAPHFETQASKAPREVLVQDTGHFQAFVDLLTELSRAVTNASVTNPSSATPAVVTVGTSPLAHTRDTTFVSAASRVVRGLTAALAVVGAMSLVKVLGDKWRPPPVEAFSVARGIFRPGCATNGGHPLSASAYAPIPGSNLLRFYIRQEDDVPWQTGGKLRLYVGEGPTCTAKPYNAYKKTVDILPGQTMQIIDLDVGAYDGKWSEGEEKTFWIGQVENEGAVSRASNLIRVQRNLLPH